MPYVCLHAECQSDIPSYKNLVWYPSTPRQIVSSKMFHTVYAQQHTMYTQLILSSASCQQKLNTFVSVCPAGVMLWICRLNPEFPGYEIASINYPPNTRMHAHTYTHAHTLTHTLARFPCTLSFGMVDSSLVTLGSAFRNLFLSSDFKAPCHFKALHRNKVVPPSASPLPSLYACPLLLRPTFVALPKLCGPILWTAILSF